MTRQNHAGTERQGQGRTVYHKGDGQVLSSGTNSKASTVTIQSIAKVNVQAKASRRIPEQVTDWQRQLRTKSIFNGKETKRYETNTPTANMTQTKHVNGSYFFSTAYSIR